MTIRPKDMRSGKAHKAPERPRGPGRPDPDAADYAVLVDPFLDPLLAGEAVGLLAQLLGEDLAVLLAPVRND